MWISSTERRSAPRNSRVSIWHSTIVDAREAEAIKLAHEHHAECLLFDERKGRELADQKRVPVIELLGPALFGETETTQLIE